MTKGFSARELNVGSRKCSREYSKTPHHPLTLWIFAPRLFSLRSQELHRLCQPLTADPIRTYRIRSGGCRVLPPEGAMLKAPPPATAHDPLGKTPPPSAATWQRWGCNRCCWHGAAARSPSSPAGSPRTSEILSFPPRTFSVCTEKSTVTYSSRSHKDLPGVKMSFMYISEAFF